MLIDFYPPRDHLVAIPLASFVRLLLYAAECSASRMRKMRRSAFWNNPAMGYAARNNQRERKSWV